MGGFGNSENLESGRFHRLRKCLDAFYNDSRGRKFTCQEVRGPGWARLTHPYFGKWTNSADPD